MEDEVKDDWRTAFQPSTPQGHLDVPGETTTTARNAPAVDAVGNSHGLPTVYAIAHEHDGHVRVDSTGNSGTTVTIGLPRRSEHGERPRSAGLSMLPVSTVT